MPLSKGKQKLLACLKQVGSYILVKCVGLRQGERDSLSLMFIFQKRWLQSQHERLS